VTTTTFTPYAAATPMWATIHSTPRGPGDQISDPLAVVGYLTDDVGRTVPAVISDGVVTAAEEWLLDPTWELAYTTSHTPPLKPDKVRRLADGTLRH
jgi:hypothetical protein